MIFKKNSICAAVITKLKWGHSHPTQSNQIQSIDGSNPRPTLHHNRRRRRIFGRKIAQTPQTRTHDISQNLCSGEALFNVVRRPCNDCVMLRRLTQGGPKSRP